MYGCGKTQWDVAAGTRYGRRFATGSLADVRSLGRRIGRLPDRRTAVSEAVAKERQQVVAGTRRVAQTGERYLRLRIEIDVVADQRY